MRTHLRLAIGLVTFCTSNFALAGVSILGFGGIEQITAKDDDTNKESKMNGYSYGAMVQYPVSLAYMSAGISMSKLTHKEDGIESERSATYVPLELGLSLSAKVATFQIGGGYAHGLSGEYTVKPISLKLDSTNYMYGVGRFTFMMGPKFEGGILAQYILNGVDTVKIASITDKTKFTGFSGGLVLGLML